MLLLPHSVYIFATCKTHILSLSLSLSRHHLFLWLFDWWILCCGLLWRWFCGCFCCWSFVGFRSLLGCFCYLYLVLLGLVASFFLFFFLGGWICGILWVQQLWWCSARLWWWRGTVAGACRSLDSKGSSWWQGGPSMEGVCRKWYRTQLWEWGLWEALRMTRQQRVTHQMIGEQMTYISLSPKKSPKKKLQRPSKSPQISRFANLPTLSSFSPLFLSMSLSFSLGHTAATSLLRSYSHCRILQF